MPEGRSEEALRLCREALRGLEQAQGPESPSLAAALNELAELEQGCQSPRAALETAERARAIEDAHGARFRGAEGARTRIRTLAIAGSVRRALGDYPGAESDLLAAAALALGEFGGASVEVARARNDLGVLYKYWGLFDEGLSLYALALDTLTAIHGAESLECATIHHNIGGILHARGDFAAAEEPARKAWEIARRLLGEDDVRTHAEAAAYAAVLDGLGRYAESEALYRRALAVFERVYSPGHEEIAVILHNLGSVLAARGMDGEAERHYRRALALKESLFGPDSPDAAMTRNNLGKLLFRTARPQEAAALLRRAVTILEARLPESHPHVITSRKNLEMAQGRI